MFFENRKGDKMLAFIFDVDDTLYDQLQPFQSALAQQVNIKELSVEKVFVRSRQYSDQVFQLAESGQITMAEMHQYRIQKALSDFGISMTTSEAAAFQRDYTRFQQEISLIADVRKTLDYCLARGFLLGVITNGPEKHQWRKIEQLQLTKWIQKENIIVSGEVGLAKPQSEIFELAEIKMGLTKSQTYYIGDSFQNDVVGAKNAGWHAVWSNRRGHLPSDASINYDYLVNDESSLLHFVQAF